MFAGVDDIEMIQSQVALPIDDHFLEVLMVSFRISRWNARICFSPSAENTLSGRSVEGKKGVTHHPNAPSSTANSSSTTTKGQT